MVTIQIKRTSVANLFDPTSGSYGLQSGELGLDLTNYKLYAGTDGKVTNNQILNPDGGVAESAAKLSVPREIALSGAVTGTTSFDGSKNVTINTTLQEVGTASEKLYAVATDAYGRVISGIATLQISDVTGLQNAIDQALASANSYTDTQIAAKLSSTYKPGGTYTFEELPEPSANLLGYVYNVSNAFTAGSNFIESEQGQSYPAGTNVAVVEIAGDPATYCLDALAGFVDVSDFVTTDSLTSQLNATKTELIGTDSGVNATTIKGAVTEAVSDAKDYTDTEVGAVSDQVQQIQTALGGTIPSSIVTSVVSGNGITVEGGDSNTVTISANVVSGNGLNNSPSGISMSVADADSFGAVKADNISISNTSGVLAIQLVDGGVVGS